MGKQRLDADLVLRRWELVLSFAVLLVDGVHLRDGDRSELRAIVGNPVTYGNVVAHVNQGD